MKQFLQFSIFLFLIFTSHLIFAQAKPIDIIARFQSNINVQKWQQAHFQVDNTTIQFKEYISERFNLAVLSYDSNQISFEEAKNFLSKDIIWVTPNHSDVISRDTPDDPMFNTQWALNSIAIDAFWDKTTNGLTWQGDTIVVVSMESGTSVNHPDLTPNFWHNYQETPNDGIDNDNNGYIDDYFGWNSIDNNDSHPYNSHGTKTSGVMAAKVDNNLGIAGLNWNVKLMPITFSKPQYSTYFKAFEYILQQRKLYNESNGAKGAFIVAVNESFGQDSVRPSDDPNFQQWCDYMDALGEVGILSIAATTNSPTTNVDEEGDMPTTCPQEHLIAVTSLGNDGIRYGGYGTKNIDLGAPGAGILSTNSTNAFSSFGGTSAAAPHVTGILALIYAYPCEKWNILIHTNPSQAALQAKKWILDNTKAHFSMQDRTVSGGSLHLEGIVDDIEFFCGGNKLKPLSLNISPTITQDIINYEYSLPTFGHFDLSIFNMLGQQLFHKTIQSDVHSLQFGTLDVSTYASGMYFVVIHQGNDFVTEKFVRWH